MDITYATPLTAILLMAVAAGIWTAITWWLAYTCIKAAIRDGIEESGLVRSWSRIVREQQERPSTGIPDMRAER